MTSSNPTPHSDPNADVTEPAVGSGASEPDTDTTSCTLCDLPTPATPITEPDVDGTFCCRGCLEVHRTLDTVDDADEPVHDALERSDDDIELESLEGETAFLAVDGMHCSTCEAFIEGSVTSTDGIHGARASYATDTVRLVYDPDVIEEGALPEAVSGVGYSARERGEARTDDARDAGLVKFLVGGGLFGMMVMVWYALFLYPTYFGYDPIVEFGGYDGLYVFANIWLMTSFVLFYTGYPILRGAYVSLRAGMPNMDLLVALAALSAYAYSTLAMATGRTDLYFDVSVAIVLVVTAGTYYEGTIKRRAAGLLSELTERRVEQARRADDGERVPLEAIDPGDRLLVRPGERVPLDGVIVEGTPAVDESLVTGESLPVEKAPGDPIRGGTVVTDAPTVLEVGADAESTLDRLVEVLWTIQSARPGVQRLADKLATVFVPLVLVIAAAVTVWLLVTGSSPTGALLVGLTVLIVSCPCALGLATPLAIASGVQSAAKRGIVVTAETIFEDAPDVDVVALDKTGTLTTGSMSVQSVHAAASVDSASVVRRAAAVEALSEHPIARAVVEYAETRTNDDSDVEPASERTNTPDVETFERTSRGVSGVVDGNRIIVGHPSMFSERDYSISPPLEEAIERTRRDGDVPVVVGWHGRARGVIAVGDAPRVEWKNAVEDLSRGRTVVVITGDEGAAADRFRDVDGVDEVFAGVPPEAKAETVRRLRARGVVAMVGDGSNDAPALAAADVGIALGSGTELAIDAADAVILSNDLEDVTETFTIASGTHRRIRQNLGWAFVYNGVAIPLAIAGVLNPLLAAVAMAASSTLVVLNSSRSL
ncbi:cation-translocating P-type ATPase [Halobacteria archaeon AArc-m2/3/4]|uniref:Cation-translocating P-type ATPase n=1 Tax=Natronoglomus mannanivorans TaxID=2979990 RepID=A0AAP2Z259_9EURY|nr:cation-translocating P-type ATPase [Halobacteria archaeon AArc-xg1-1]MCU4975807.1 cation-translocating P-type ATPase [Halobacteria archaeon AArc-m2/3/4]